MLRYLFGFTGAALTNGALGPGCTRCDATAIHDYIASTGASRPLGHELQAHVYSTSNQRRPSTAELGALGFVVVWQSNGQDGDGDGVFARRFSAAGVPPPSRTIDCNSLAAARALLLESDRLMLLSAHQIHYELEAGLLHAMPHPIGNVTRSIGLTVRKDWRPTPTQARLLDLLREHAKAATPRSRASRERPLDAVR